MFMEAIASMEDDCHRHLSRLCERVGQVLDAAVDLLRQVLLAPVAVHVGLAR